MASVSDMLTPGQAPGGLITQESAPTTHPDSHASSIGVSPYINPPKKTSVGRKHGDIGIPIGAHFKSRNSCWRTGVHPHPIAGISGSRETGAWAICLSGGYEDDVDAGEIIYYTGAGGRKTSGFHTLSPQSYDQSFESRSNQVLLRSVETGNPVRVIRGFGGNPAYAPKKGYRYDGLYTVTNAEEVSGKKGHKICLFTLERNDKQDPLPDNKGFESGDEFDF